MHFKVSFILENGANVCLYGPDVNAIFAFVVTCRFADRIISSKVTRRG